MKQNFVTHRPLLLNISRWSYLIYTFQLLTGHLGLFSTCMKKMLRSRSQGELILWAAFSAQNRSTVLFGLKSFSSQCKSHWNSLNSADRICGGVFFKLKREFLVLKVGIRGWTCSFSNNRKWGSTSPSSEKPAPPSAAAWCLPCRCRQSRGERSPSHRHHPHCHH